ncbi:tetratricopeptide repeat protein [bacterium]|nr:tetratricopeptide repeat protein [bacterium]
MRRLSGYASAFVLCLVAGCGGTRPAAPLIQTVAAPAGEAGAVDLGAFLSLPEPERERRRQLADADLARFDRWRQDIPSLLRRNGIYTNFFGGNGLLSEGRRTIDDLDRMLPLLQRIAQVDPDCTEAWTRMGDFFTQYGDWSRADAAYAAAWEAWPHDPRLEDRAQTARSISLAHAWLCRDTARWEQGLALLGRGDGTAAVRPADQDQLLRGLLLAGAGRFREAVAVALEMPPLKYPRYGYGMIAGSHANNWIEAMAWFAIGEPAFARKALGEIYTHRALQQAARYWNDVALILDLVGDDAESDAAYVRSLQGRFPLPAFFPYEGCSVPPVILDEPSPTVPVYLAWGEHYLAGSLFAFAANSMARYWTLDDEARRPSRGRAVIEALSICMRKHDRPTLAQALRGRMHYYLGEDEEALVDLRAARAALTAEGRGDAATSLVLGTVLMNRRQMAEALPCLQEAVDLEPDLAGAWRTLGVALAKLDRHAEADSVLDRAVDLDPFEISGWYNRGLHHLERRRWEPACRDLGVAVRLEPDNADALEMMQVAQSALLREGGRETAALMSATADSTAAGLRAGRGLERSATRDALGIALSSVAGVDQAALADSLAASYERSPTADLRQDLAAALLKAGRHADLQDLLAHLWLRDLAPLEQQMLLEADRALGSAERSLSLIGRLAAGELAPGDPVRDDPALWSRAALICLDAGHREQALLALDEAAQIDPQNAPLGSFRELVRNSPLD